MSYDTTYSYSNKYKIASCHTEPLMSELITSAKEVFTQSVC